MSVTKKLLEASGGGGDEPTYVDDVFSTYLYEGNGTARDIVNGIPLGDSGAGGSVSFDGNGDYLETPDDSAFAIGTNDFTVEAWVYPRGRGDTFARIMQGGKYGNATWNTTDSWGLFDRHNDATTKFSFAAVNLAGNALVLESTSNVVDYAWTHIAVTRQGTTFRLFVNGVLEDTYTSSSALTTSSTVGVFVQHPVEQLNSLISNVRIVNGTAVYTANFTVPTSALTAVANTALLTCQGDNPFVDNSTNSLAITKHGDVLASTHGPFASDIDEKGGLVWIKNRSIVQQWFCWDTERGLYYLVPNGTDAEVQNLSYHITSYNSDGFSLHNGGSGDNAPGNDYASWTFAKQEGFFDIVTYTGNGVAGREIPHNLGSEPGMIIVKQTSSSRDWVVYHRSLGAGKYFHLNKTDAAVTGTGAWNNVEPTSSVFTVASGALNNANNGEYVAYIFAHDAPMFGPNGDESIIKCGISGPFSTIDLGWEPQWVLVKAANTNQDWYLLDSMREYGGVGTNTTTAALRPSATSIEHTSSEYGSLTPTGFTLGNYGPNIELIYMAIRRPNKPAEEFEPDELFAVESADGAVLPAFKSGWPVDSAFTRAIAGNSGTWISARLMQNTALGTNSSDAAAASTLYSFDYSNGYNTQSNVNPNILAWMFRRAPGFFDVVTYEGDGVVGREVSHNLEAVPEMMWVKNLGVGRSWQVYSNALGGTYRLLVNADIASQLTDRWNNTNPTNEVFSVGSNQDVNKAADEYIAYLWASVPGICDIGSYTGTGNALNVDCGFTNGARFILIKRTDSTGDWYYWDTLRGIVSGNDPYLLLNSTAAQVTTTDYIDPLSSGFTVTAAAPAALNNNGGTYIYMAIA